MFGIVYLVQPEEYLNTSTYKIGMSASNTTKRIRAYGKHTRTIAVAQCKEPHPVEAELIKEFNARFTLTRGREFFSGNEKEMILAFHECISPDIVVDNEDKPENNDTQDSPDMPDIVVDNEDESENNVKLNLQDSPEYALLQQHLNATMLNREIYDLLMILPDQWFKNTNNIDRMVYGLRNTIPDPLVWLYSVKCVLQKRWNCYNDHYLLRLVVKQLNSAEGRLTFGKIKNEIRDKNSGAYNQWKLLYKSYKHHCIAYKKGANISLELAQALLPKDKLTPAKLSKVHPPQHMHKVTMRYQSTIMMALQYVVFCFGSICESKLTHT